MNRRSLELFHQAAEEAPAYKDFLKKNKINPEKIKTWADFESIPAVSKDNYLRRYPLPKLCFGGTLGGQQLVFTSTSGSTGRPFYFPRDEGLDRQYADYLEMFLKNILAGAKPKPTLVIDAFGMGVWIGGLITYQAWRMLALRGHPITIITPGINKKEIFDALKNLAGDFEQVVLCGYPPFIKDVIDEGEKAEGIVWKKINLKFLFAAEAFSESYRDYLAKKTGLKNIYRDTANIYGSADLGAMAIETPVAILARRLAVKNQNLFKNLFGSADKLPTLAQSNPNFINFEAPDGTILCTGRNALPLVRYAIGDRGGALEMKKLAAIFAGAGIDLMKECRRLGLEKTVKNWPFVYVYERADLSVKLFGAIIYPEHIKRALLDRSLENSVTGKFSMKIEFDDSENQYLRIHLELKYGVGENARLAKDALRMIVESLLANNAEYKNNYQMMPDKVTPKISLWRYEHPDYFKPGTKQKYVI